jgi:hypothetical protein
MDCNLQKAKQVIEGDQNGSELTDENSQVVLSILACEIKQLTTMIYGTVKTGK